MPVARRKVVKSKDNHAKLRRWGFAAAITLAGPAWVMARHLNTGRNHGRGWVERFHASTYSRNPKLPKIRPCFRSSHPPMLHAVALSKPSLALPKCCTPAA